MPIETESFGATDSGQQVERFRLLNSSGNSISVMNWGATLMDVHVPDRNGTKSNVNLCFDALAPYQRRHPYFGSTVGRFCNRIAGGRFAIDGQTYQVTQNQGDNHLHGGIDNFSFRFWSAQSVEGSDPAIRFQLSSHDGDEGYPGAIDVAVEYRWNDNSELTIAYEATCDAPTHVNLCNHSYWNLGGAGSGSAMDHVAEIQADQFLDVDAELIPTGKLRDVEGTPLDFRTPTALGLRIDQLSSTGGYDHCYAVRGTAGTLRPAARVIDPASGRTLEVLTTQPGMQLYTANHLPGNEISGGHGGHEAFCLETQHFPDAPNHSHFLSTLLRPGESLSETTVYRFGCQ